MNIKNIHEKLMESIQQMLIDTKVNLPYYGNFNLFVSFNERKDIDTCAVNMTPKGMNFYYNSDFLNRLTQKEVNFITLHEDFHLLWNHPKRTITGQYDQKLSNIAQDMIINHIIWEDIPHSYVEIPKDADGKNMALFIPKEYTGKLIFEEVYEWLRDEKEKRDKQKKQNECKSCKGTGEKQDDQNGGKGQSDPNSQGQEQGNQPCDDCDGSGQKDGDKSGSGSSYGPYGKDPRNPNGNLDTWSLDQILDNLDKNQGQYLDQHLGDEIPEEMRESMVKDAMDRLSARGLSGGNIEQTLDKLRKQRKDYLKYIKRTLSNVMFGTTKTRTIVKPNRRGIFGVKGNKKIKNKINCILDTSGSMGGQGTFERVLSYINRNDIEVNLIESDTEIKWVQNIKSKKQLESVCIKGLGGTIMQSGFNYVVENFNEYNTVLLTDGYTDSLDLSKVKGNVLIISVGVECPISKSNGRLKQIVLEPTE
jgi:predicted metal-dependent peptidase